MTTRPILIGVLSLLAACRKPTENSAGQSSEPKKVHCAPVETRNVRDELVLHGTASPLPDRDALVAAQVQGRILRVLVREGDSVATGQPVAHIDDAPLADQARQAAAQLEKARAESTLAETSRARVQRVFDRGIAARQELDDATTRVATARAQETEAIAANEIARRQLARAVVRSPLAGVVLRLIRKTGELVDGTPSTPIVEVGDPSRLELVATATASELVQVKRQASASVEFPALPRLRFDGTVAAVSPAVDRSTGLGAVRVELDLKAGVRPPVGIAGTAQISVGASRQALVIPAASMRAAIGQEAEVVLCAGDGRARVVRIRRGMSGPGWTEVLPPDGTDAGLDLVAGVQVVVSPVLGVSDGDRLERAR